MLSLLNSENVTEFTSRIPEILKIGMQDLAPRRCSLFPLVYGRTSPMVKRHFGRLYHTIERCGQGKVTGIPTEEETEEVVSFLG